MELWKVRDFLRGEMPDGCNEMVVVFIPKVPQPERMYLRPISLCLFTVYSIRSKL